MFAGFKSIAKTAGGPIRAAGRASLGGTPVAHPAPGKSRSKYYWVVLFTNGDRYEIESAKGPRDARLQALWMHREAKGHFPNFPIAEVQKHPRHGNGLMYSRWRIG